MQAGNRPPEDGVLAFGIVQLAAKRAHRLPHDRMAEPHQHLVLLEPHDPVIANFVLDQGRVEHQFHAVGAGAHGERLPGQAFPAGRRFQTVESRASGDLFQRTVALNGDGRPQDVREGRWRNAQPRVGAF